MSRFSSTSISIFLLLILPFFFLLLSFLFSFLPSEKHLSGLILFHIQMMNATIPAGNMRKSTTKDAKEARVRKQQTLQSWGCSGS